MEAALLGFNHTMFTVCYMFHYVPSTTLINRKYLESLICLVTGTWLGYVPWESSLHVGMLKGIPHVVLVATAFAAQQSLF